MVDRFNDLEVQVTLTTGQCKALASLARQEARRKRRRAEASDFTPEPGHKDMNLARAEMLERTHEQLMALVQEVRVP